PRQARHHRLGADQRLARRGQHAGKAPAPRRARSLLHRELVAPVRRLHPGAHAVRAAPLRKRLLMAFADPHACEVPAAAAAPPPGARRRAAGAFVDRLQLRALWLVGVSSGFVMIEPAPYEFLIVIAAIIFAATGLTLRTGHLPLMLMLIFYNIGFVTALVPVI